MKFEFPQLDDRTRQLMLEELEVDLVEDRVYYGKRLNESGCAAYLTALRKAIESGIPEDLAQALSPVPGGYWIPEIRNKLGRRSPTPVTAAQTLAEGEFNRYYMRAIALRSIEEGNGRVVVWRAKPVANPRDRDVKVDEGDELDARAVLEDIRRHPGEPTELGMPRGPNSGLSIRF